MGFLDQGRTLNVAHRGASAVAPQNTLTAFEKALEMGADGIELDTRLSSDGIPVVIHDSTVDATTNGHGRVADLTLRELQQFDAGLWFSPAYAGERIPTLQQVLGSVGSRTLINIELKSHSPRDTGLEAAVVSLVQRMELCDHILLSSFNPWSLRRVKGMAPNIPVGLLEAPTLRLPLPRAWLSRLIPHEARHPEHVMVDSDYATWARKRGYKVNTWTVNDAAEMRRLTALGVDAIITDVPDVLRDVLHCTAEAPG